MKNCNIQKLLTVFYLFLVSNCLFLLLPDSAQASSVVFEPQEYSIGAEGSFAVSVVLIADTDINAVEVGIRFSDGLVPVDINEGNSIINMWVEKPVWNKEENTLYFSGIVPGGYRGKGQLLDIYLDAKSLQSDGSLSFTRTSRAFRNDAEATSEVLVLGRLDLPYVPGKENMGAEIPDEVPPASFAPEIARSPLIYNNNWFVTFYTSDKGLGMLKFEVAERRGMSIENHKKLDFKEAESPYELSDQALRSTVYVRAIDKAGNSHTEIVLPQDVLPWYENPLIWIIIILVIVAGIVFYVWKRTSQNISL